MKLAMSNIAWNSENNSEALELLKKYKISRLEIAPTKLWALPGQVSQEEAFNYKKSMQQIGIKLVAMQSLLFNRLDLVLFSTESARQDMLSFLFRLIDLCAWLEIPIMVFGSPKNRVRGHLSQAEAKIIAVPFFKTLGDYAAEKNVCFCIEANSMKYGCDFITSTDEAYDLVKEVNSIGFGLHLDLGNMIMSKENWSSQIKKYMPVAKHFHLSAPELGPVGDLSELSMVIKLLSSFPNVVSIEMRPTEKGVQDVEKSISKIESSINDN